MDEWIHGVKDHKTYQQKLGLDRVRKLREMENDNYRIPQINVAR